MSAYPPPTGSNSLVFNPDNFWSETDFITLGDADARYLKISGGGITGSLVVNGTLSAGSLMIGGSSVDLSSISGVVAGTASANKALIVDGARNITNINNIGCASLNAFAINPTTKTISTFSVDNVIWYQNSGRFFGMRQPDTNSFSLLSYSEGGGFNDKIIWYHNGAASNAYLSISGSLTVSNNITATNLTGTLQTAAQPNITSIGTLTSLNVGSANIDSYGYGAFAGLLSTGTLSVDNGSASSGSATVSQVWDYDSMVQVMLTMRSWITGTNYAEFGLMTDQEFRFMQNGSTRLTLQTSGNVKVHNSLVIGSSTMSSAMVDYLTSITAGTAAASKALVVDASKNISGIAALGCTSLTTSTLTLSGALTTTGITFGSAYGDRIVNLCVPTSTTNQYAIGVAADYILYQSKKGHQFFTSSTTSSTGSEIAKFDNKNFFYGDAIASVIDLPTADLKGGIVGGTKGSGKVYWRLGNHGSTNNLMTMEWTPSSDGGSANKLHFDPWGTSNALVIACSNRVSINGDIDTGYRLKVHGNVKATSGIDCDGTSNFTDITHTYARTGYDVAKARYAMLSSTAIYCGIGMDDVGTTVRIGQCSDATLAWSGSYCSVRGGSYTNASDIRLKKDIEDLPYGLNDVMQMHPVKYTLKEDDTTHIGFIAQELQHVIPIAVSGEPDAVDSNGVIRAMGIDLASLTSICVKAIQELNDEIADLKQQLSSITGYDIK